MKSEIHSENEFNNKSNVYIMPNLKESIEKLKNMDINDIHSVDEAKWFFIHNQIMTLKQMNLPDEEVRRILQEKIEMQDVFNREVLQEVIQEKINELIESGMDLSNKMVTTSISLDSDFNRKLEINLIDIEDSNIGFQNFNNELPDFNPVIENQIKTVCEEMLCGTIDDINIQDFINDRIIEYKENPYTIDWLEGFIEGYLSNLNE